MSGLKSAWELSLEKSDKMVPGLKNKKKLTDKQKQEIDAIRKEYKARIADKEVMLQHQLDRLSERTRPEELYTASEELKREFAAEKERLEKEMEQKVEAIHESRK
ncbi:hypothetical protein NITGR_640004 [Nitrospina gracilis 3/211]|uniref:Uncharacterized protein n=1 Tax=Nitrospina gracilis (strain 3/211) TaxID=1266370 RepID=M1YLJ4_NITG3|nr:MULTISPECIES: hypothetical protein [Nitrospina]MCF8724210.1 C-terminal processing protease CtpA/Prc [Nitrospina sp. Nb-3]CCQ91357.1 hypothetical protein NITGR_640004 [Nitrospina gracilis 3/211]